jgi:hypothetical protein
MDCPNCRRPAPAGATECGDCGLIFAKAPLTARQSVLIPAAAFSISFIFVSTSFGRFFTGAGLSMQVHELGHALVAWLGGRIAVPIPMVTLTFSRDRSWLMASAVTGGLCFLAWRAWEEDCRAFVAVCGAALLLQAKLTLFTTADALDFWVAFGGLGGECYVAALLAVLYFVRWPKFTRWPVYRTLFLFVGACVLWNSLHRWREASVDYEKVPFGSFFGGDGDVEAMLSHGWTVNTLVAVYLRLAWACVAACGLTWAWVLRDFGRLWRSPAELLD